MGQRAFRAYGMNLCGYCVHPNSNHSSLRIIKKNKKTWGFIAKIYIHTYKDIQTYSDPLSRRKSSQRHRRHNAIVLMHFLANSNHISLLQKANFLESLADILPIRSTTCIFRHISCSRNFGTRSSLLPGHTSQIQWQH